MARLERMEGLWHQSVKVTAKMIPWHTVAGGLLDWWVSPASRKHLRAYVPLPGLRSPPPPTRPCRWRVLWQKRQQDGEGNKIWHFNTLSRSCQNCPPFAPNQHPEPFLSLFFSSLPPLPQCFLFRALAAAVQELPFIRRPAHGRFTGDTSDQMHICSSFFL